ncbi:MAG: hypothetical protein V4542_00875 [Pseudomonadota bacterium]
MRKFLPLLGVVLLAGCASPYQKNGMGGGFDETQLDANVWRVSFKGNGYTKGERTEDLALLRSADLTLMNGYSFFVLADARSRTDVGSYTTPLVARTTSNAYRVGNQVYGSATTNFTGGQTTFISRPTAMNTVVMFKEKPATDAMVFDAAFICQSIGKKYEIVCGTVK